jgi:hypothetical protein
VDASAAIESQGYAVVENAVGASLCDELARAFPAGEKAGSRRLLEHSVVAEAVAHLRSRSPVASLLPHHAVAVQCTLFSKSDAANWLVPAHQDLGIPVAGRVDDEACAGWSEKEGRLFVQPPVAVLERLLAVRVQLDDAPPRAGELRVAAGSHRLGRLPARDVAAVAARRPMKACVVPRAGALVLRPLLVHASGKAPAGVVRRVLHLLFGPPELPYGLRWANTL